MATQRMADLARPSVAPAAPTRTVPGVTAPPGKKMGHAGAIVSGGQGTAESKVRAFEEAGIPVASAPSEIPRLVKEQIAIRA